MKSFYRYILVLALAILFLLEVSSCGRSTSLVPELSQAENCMEARPDSALALLQAVDTLQLTTEEQKAKYVLLLSMALDKNVIDRTDFAILQPAIDYYADHGSGCKKRVYHLYIKCLTLSFCIYIPKLFPYVTIRNCLNGLFYA